MYKIGMFAKMNKVTVKTLRYYDEIGLLKPSYIDEDSGYRYYKSDKLPVLHEILYLRQIGFSIDEIKKAREGMEIEYLLRRKKAKLLQDIAESTKKLSQIEYYLLNGNNDKDYKIILKEIPETIIAYMRSIIPNYSCLTELAAKMNGEMEKLGCERMNPEYCFNVYYDGEYSEENIDVEVCEAITELKCDTDKIKFKVMPKVESAACILHKGSYLDLPKAYETGIKWIEKNNYKIIDNPREYYIDGIWNKDSEEDWLTEIQFPIEKLD